MHWQLNKLKLIYVKLLCECEYVCVCALRCIDVGLKSVKKNDFIQKSCWKNIQK